MPTPGFELGVLPPEATPTIPAGDDIVLYIHGGPGSRLEEASDLVGPLHAAGECCHTLRRVGPPTCKPGILTFRRQGQSRSLTVGAS
jgi:hypothetical protein